MKRRRIIKSLKLPAVWFPHTLMGISTADIVEDTTHGQFGPFAGQYFVSDQGHSKVMRMTLGKSAAVPGCLLSFPRGLCLRSCTDSFWHRRLSLWWDDKSRMAKHRTGTLRIATAGVDR